MQRTAVATGCVLDAPALNESRLLTGETLFILRKLIPSKRASNANLGYTQHDTPVYEEEQLLCGNARTIRGEQGLLDPGSTNDLDPSI
jgi:hypothetical protein